MARDDRRDQATDWHFLLLSLAGRMSDDVITRCRGLLADGRPAAVGPTLVAAALAQDVSLFEVEAEFLTHAMAGTGADQHPYVVQARLAQVRLTDVGEPMRYGFAGRLPATAVVHADGTDDSVIDVVATLPGPRGLWGSWRLSTEHDEARRVYVVEADDDADLISIAGRVQYTAGGRDPQVEVYPTGADLPTYQRFARAYGELLWSRTPDPGVRIAALFDDVDPNLGPVLRPDHPRVGGAERASLVDYLRRGELLLDTTARLVDIVDPSRGAAVAMSFRTDGRWVWSDATTYYLEVHGLLPDPQLAAHIRAQGAEPPLLDDVARHRAMAALSEPLTEEPAWTYGATG